MRNIWDQVCNSYQGMAVVEEPKGNVRTWLGQGAVPPDTLVFEGTCSSGYPMSPGVWSARAIEYPGEPEVSTQQRSDATIVSRPNIPEGATKKTTMVASFT